MSDRDCAQDSSGTEADQANAKQLLLELCNDILDNQIGTSMFWRGDDLKDDYFAEHVHYFLLKASRAMGWKHYDSSAAWSGQTTAKAKQERVSLYRLMDAALMYGRYGKGTDHLKRAAVNYAEARATRDSTSSAP